jgi:hypothetical protein
MKLKTLKPLYLGGKTLTEGTPFITDEQHGRQLINKGFAEEHDGDEEVAVDLTDVDGPAEALTTDNVAAGQKTKAPSKKKAD